MKYDLIPASLFIENRKRFAAKLKPNSIAIFHSNDIMPRSADGQFPFRQDADLLYLTGADQEETIFFSYPDCPRPEYREVLFLRKTNKVIAQWEGHKLTMKEAQENSGINAIYWVEDFNPILKTVMSYAENVYLDLNEHDRLSNEVPYKNLRFAKELKELYPLHNYLRTAPIMHELRSIKNKIEIDLMQRAADITDKAFRRVLGFVKPRIFEYEVEAEIIHEFIRNRATGHAYSPIIASGKNACALHYVDNNKLMRDGEMLLMDFGAEYANYAADMTRTIPVNGKFTKRQRDIYNAVLRVMKQAKNMLRPGLNLHEYNTVLVGKLMEEELVKLRLLRLRDIKKQDPNNPLYKKYFMHGTSHYLGLDVHDVGTRFATVKAGMVFTCEPGIYIPEESIGVRIENNILVTKGEPFDLMANIPIEVDEIEALMAKK
jgi:Xaa-Pro aminopeptidase